MSLFLALAASTLQASQAGPLIEVRPKSGPPSEIVRSKDPLSEKLIEALKRISDKAPSDALPILDEVIAGEEARNADEKRLIFSARSIEEALLYAGTGAARKKAAVVLDDTWSTAYFAKGFALVDLDRSDEAKPYFDKAIALAPMNAQFLAERGEWYKNRKDWENAYKDFQSASGAAPLAPEKARSPEQRRAWRGMAYARTEEGKLDEARQLLQNCLKLDASDDKCQHELDYVNGLRARAN